MMAVYFIAVLYLMVGVIFLLCSIFTCPRDELKELAENPVVLAIAVVVGVTLWPWYIIDRYLT